MALDSKKNDPSFREARTRVKYLNGLIDEARSAGSFFSVFVKMDRSDLSDLKLDDVLLVESLLVGRIENENRFVGEPDAVASRCLALIRKEFIQLLYKDGLNDHQIRTSSYGPVFEVYQADAVDQTLLGELEHFKEILGAGFVLEENENDEDEDEE